MICHLGHDLSLSLSHSDLSLSVGPVCLQAALQELEELKQIVPKESLVYFLIGKVRNIR